MVKNHIKLLRICESGLLSFFALGMFFSCSVIADAKITTSSEQASAEALEEERQAVYNKKIDSNSIENWPQGPQIYAESAIVMEASTGAVLYNKDMHMVNYPASITKIMTALVTLEHCSLDEIVSYSYYATHSIEAGSSTIGTTEGEELTVEESLYALLLESANECGNGLAEHVAGSIDAFVMMMNEKALELGCTNTHFVNPHGLPDEEHYTSAYDMALITQAALQYEDFVRISGAERYQIPATNKDNEITYMKNHHKMIASYNGDERFLDDTVIAGKTGYTFSAKNTLATVARWGGMTFIVITMHTIPTAETGIPTYTDTALLLDYASENFKKVNVAANETKFLLSKASDFPAADFILEQSIPSFCINADDSIILPNEADFKDASLEFTFMDDNPESDMVAMLFYTYKDHPIGFAAIEREETAKKDSAFDSEDILTGDSDLAVSDQSFPQKQFIIINIRLIFIGFIIVVSIFLIYKLICYVIDKYEFSIKFSYWRQKRRRRRKRKPVIAGRKKGIYSGKYYGKVSERKSFDDVDL